MRTISLRVPDSVHKQVIELAKQEGISVDQFAASALSEKMAAMVSADYLKVRARRGSRRKFERALAKVPKVQPEGRDRL